MDVRTIKRALISVYDKQGLFELARCLGRHGVELISTGGTRQALVDAGLAVRDVSHVTGFPEMLDGRVKTLHPLIHGGILAVRDNPRHMDMIVSAGIGLIDLVVCNLYPFEKVLARPESTEEEIIENIDIGGPSMVRAAAKNFRDVAIVTSPAQYEEIIHELDSHGGALPLALRQRLAAAAFEHTASYDRAISDYCGLHLNENGLPSVIHLTYARRSNLRYGENPHQEAAFYAEPGVQRPCVATADVLHGKELSYNNILDLDSALSLVQEFADPAAVVIKHNNPCGAAVASTLCDAFGRAYAGDPQSAFGGVLAFNRPLDEATASRVAEPNRFIECIIAPDYEPAAFELITTRPSWKKNVRLLRTGAITGTSSVERRNYRQVGGGLLVQAPDAAKEDRRNWKVVTRRQPTEPELEDMHFAWVICKHVKSNAIVLAKDRMVVGVGAGQMSRVDSVHMATRKAGDRVKGSIMASDAFFPFRDNVDLAGHAGITAIVEPGGSIRDADSIQACDEYGMAMVFTGIRHFRH
jgi:phosphoribosylaminoimidazolecarboxamide formyltransferase / IMP cyclohydrolase